jgi:hypothetical protein
VQGGKLFSLTKTLVIPILFISKINLINRLSIKIIYYVCKRINGNKLKLDEMNRENEEIMENEGDAGAEYSNKNYSTKDLTANEDWYISWLAFIAGAKWQEKRMYSEEEVKEIIKLSCEEGMLIQRTINDKVKIPYWRIKDFTIRIFQQFKKK